MLKRSNDRKTANLADATGKKSIIKNAFGLPSGAEYSCPGATAVCERVCYAGKLEVIYPSVRSLLTHNWDELQGKTRAEMSALLTEMIAEFVVDCSKRGAQMKFRIHWDGDFFSRDYALAWADTMGNFPDVQFWAYTRSFIPGSDYVGEIADVPNLALYLSVDAINRTHATAVLARHPRVRIAALTSSMAESGLVISDLRRDSKPGGACPELTKQIPLISPAGGACFSCGLCIEGKADVRFAAAKVAEVAV